MSLKQVDDIFGRYVQTFIRSDIERELQLARLADAGTVLDDVNPGGGNVLAALGLVCYTEFLGSFVTGSKGMGWSRKNGEAFLKRMGPCYRRQLQKHGRLWDVFRNGLAHEYAVKETCDIFMLKGDETCGIGKRNGRYFFVVERYFEDLMAGAEKLYAELRLNPIIPAKVRHHARIRHP